jgi:hypothetical protein
MYNNGNSSKNVTGSSIVDGTVETVDIADDAVTADKLANTINTDIALGVAALPKSGGTMTGPIRKDFGETNSFYLNTTAAATTYNFQLSVPEIGGNNSFGVMLTLTSNRYTLGQSHSIAMIQGDLDGTNPAVFRLSEVVLLGTESFTIASVSSTLTSLNFSITLDTSWYELYVESHAFAAAGKTPTLTKL